MPVCNPLKTVALLLALSILAVPAVRADQEAQPIATVATDAASTGQQALVQAVQELPPQAPEVALQESRTLLQRASSSVETTLDSALDLIGIRYRRGGNNPEKGFDCSGFVSHVFREGLGLYLPHSAKAMSGTGEKVDKHELQPGDLVFFNTMRRTFSHVGIYLGDSLFVHAPRTGGKVRIEDMSARYWVKRFNGARRIVAE